MLEKRKNRQEKRKKLKIKRKIVKIVIYMKNNPKKVN